MRYLTLAEAMLIAEAVTGIEARTLVRACRVDKAAVLAVRIAKNHPLPDGNKRLAWAALNLFCELNGKELRAEVDDAVETMLAVAAGTMDEAALAGWVRARLA